MQKFVCKGFLCKKVSNEFIHFDFELFIQAVNLLHLEHEKMVWLNKYKKESLKPLKIKSRVG